LQPILPMPATCSILCLNHKLSPFFFLFTKHYAMTVSS
jgi:hypothetical protein